MENFVHTEDCLAALDELQRRWCGRVFHLPDRSTAARRAEAELISGGRLRLEVGQDERLELDLRPHGEIGDGRALDRENWWCEETAGGIALRLARSEGVTYSFARVGPGYWAGQRLRPPVVPSSLTPCGDTGARTARHAGLVDELVRAARLGRPDAEETALAEALLLLARVEPGAIRRVGELAAAGPGRARPALARILSRLERASEGGRSDIYRDVSVLRTGYSETSGDGAK